MNAKMIIQETHHGKLKKQDRRSRFYDLAGSGGWVREGYLSG